jgi:hypothetical protein
MVGVSRDMEVTRARCRASGTCSRGLVAGSATADSHDFRPNAATIDELLTSGA